MAEFFEVFDSVRKAVRSAVPPKFWKLGKSHNTAGSLASTIWELNGGSNAWELNSGSGDWELN